MSIRRVAPADLDAADLDVLVTEYGRAVPTWMTPRR